MHDGCAADGSGITPDESAGFLAGGGELGSLLRAHDWSKSSLGAPDTWPQSLKTVVRVMLTSRQPIWIGWGPELLFFYNDAYKTIIGGKHPWALGRPTSQVWSEIWNDIEPLLIKAMGGVEGTYVEDQLLIMERNGYPEETFYTFSYSPVPNDDGTPGGIICANTDETSRVRGERQLALLRDLSASVAGARSWQDACVRSASSLAKDTRDFTFALIYMAQAESGPLHLAAATGIEPGHRAAPEHAGSPSHATWPFDKVSSDGEPLIVSDLVGRFGPGLPTGAWSVPSRQAAIVPIPSANKGVLIVGLNPYRVFDETYRNFVELVASQIGAASANADAYDYERRRVEALTELDQAKTAFFANLSHEFRTPLTLMLAPLEEAVVDEAIPETGRERLKLVHRNSLRLLKLVNALLDFSRIESGRVKASFEPTDLGAFTGELASSFESATSRAGLSLDIETPALAEHAFVDRDMWEKIVLNLLSNAFKFTFEGGIQVRTGLTEHAVELLVRDTGTGIAEAELPRLFDRFHRIEGARGRSFEGSGIGLALVKELVDLHGGTIRVESEFGKGTSFFVRVPLGQSHLPAEQIRARAVQSPDSMRSQAYVEEAMRWLPDSIEPPGTPSDTDSAIARIALTPVPQDRARIVIAEDNTDMREYIVRLLSAHHACEAVADGAQALERIRALRPQLLLTDIMMPNLDGFGLIKAIREDTELRDLPIIALSARAGEEASVVGLTVGADDYLVKPFSARELIARVDGALKMARVRAEMTEAVRDEARSLEILNRIGSAVAAELDLDRAVQVVTDAATELTGAAFGAFFYNVLDDKGESYMLYTLSGAPREAFSRFPMPRNTAIFAPTFAGDGIVRSDDILVDPRYGRNEPHFGMPKGHLPVRSYLAIPVTSRSGEVLGGLFFGHPQPGIFTSRAERLIDGIAKQAAIAIDNARLYQAAQTEIAVRTRTEAALRTSEEAQLRLNQTLEAKVVERTAEIAAANQRLLAEAAERERVEFALRQSQKMEAVGKLTGGVAHDFNNLLQVIAGNLQLLSKDVSGNDKAEQRLRNALGGVSRGSKLAAQLLAFGRRQPLTPKVVNLGRFVRSLDDLLRRALGDGVEIETIIGGGLWNVLVDPSQVENALLNLAINARDAMDAHGKLTIEAGNAALGEDYAARHEDVKAGQYVMLAVTDTGCGMTPEIVAQVFEPFFTTKPEGQGTGLGLSMVYGFVKQSGGHIAIYSEKDHGTTIRIYLPRVMQDEDVLAEVETGPVVGGSETVLVAEDDANVRETVVELMADLGYRVLKAKDALTALAIIDSGVPIDLLFTDVVMPGPMRSPELARKARERRPNLAVLFTSGYTDNAIVHGGRLDPGVDLLSKPYRREALARKIRHVLRNQQQRNASAANARSVAPLPAASAPATDLRIVLVEDDPNIREATADMLRMIGHTVVEAGDAVKALHLLAQSPLDVLITDISLPGMSGDELAVEARRRYPHLHIIYASGHDIYAGAGNIKPALEAPLLRKPYRLTDLTRILQSVPRAR